MMTVKNPKNFIQTSIGLMTTAAGLVVMVSNIFFN
jgi:hypothetical protein